MTVRQLMESLLNAEMDDSVVVLITPGVEYPIESVLAFEGQPFHPAEIGVAGVRQAKPAQAPVPGVVRIRVEGTSGRLVGGPSTTTRKEIHE